MRKMNMLNSKSLKKFVKGAFVLIGLIFILSYGVAALALHFNGNIEISKNHEITKNIENDKKIETDKKLEIVKNFDDKLFALVLILVILPIGVFIFVLFKFSSLVKSFNETLYKSSINERSLLKLHDIKAVIEMCRMAVKDKNMIQKNMRRRCKKC